MREYNFANPPRLTADLLAALEVLKAMADVSIDTSDIPPLSDEFWKNAMRNPLYRQT
jgi:hypothetical protein